MSDENPYGGEGTPPPGNYPAGGYYAPQPRSDRWKIWLGIGLSIPALIATGILTGTLGYFDSSGTLSVFGLLAGLVVPIVMLFFDATRKVALGLLIGYAVIFILFAGTCIVLLASYN